MSNEKSGKQEQQPAKVASVGVVHFINEVEIPRRGHTGVSRQISTSVRKDSDRKPLETTRVVYIWGSRQFQITIVDHARNDATTVVLVPVENVKQWTMIEADKAEGDEGKNS